MFTATREETAIILAAHGSSTNKNVNQPMFDLSKRISAELNSVFVTPAFLDGCPDIRSITEEIEHNRIVAIPFMASNGYYTDVVFKQALMHPTKAVHIASAIGTHLGLIHLVCERIAALARDHEPNNSTFVVVGHGTRKNRNSCRTTVELVKQARAHSPELTIEFAFIDQNPSVEHVVARMKTENVVVIPFMMGLGPHVTQDIPNAFGIKDFEGALFQSAMEYPYQQSVEGRLGLVRNVIYDAPVGLYPGLSDICVSIANSHLESTDNENKHHMEVV